MNLKIEKKNWKKLGWAAIIFFIVKGTITSAAILYTLYWGFKAN
ncbi:hypothetical protein N9544_00585 [Flavobacteriales bacterium]|nr:hypothetical protein [Flavobacteriales bacterium]